MSKKKPSPVLSNEDLRTSKKSVKDNRSRVALALVASVLAFLVVTVSQSASAAVTCDIGFEEIGFDYATATNIVGTGFNVGDKVLYSGVATRTCGGVPTTIDALVTTSALVDATVVHYEVDTASAGPDTSANTTTNFFEVDITALRTGGHADFTFAFYKQGTYPSAPVPITLENVKATAIDIDNKTYGIISSLDSFTLANDTRLSNNYGGGGFPATVTFTGAASNGTNDIRDRVTASYSTLQTFIYRVGVGDKDSNGQTLYFGLAFQDLGWSPSTPVTTGTEYTLSYNANGGTGTTPTSVTATVGSALTIATNTGPTPLVRTNYTFTNWNTQANGLGTTYAPGASTFMPGSNVTLYAIWTPVDHTLSYDLNGAAGTPPTSQTVTHDTTATVTSSVPTRTGYTFTGWNTLANGTGTSYATGATTSPITTDITLYAIWLADEVTTTTSTTSTTLPASTTTVPVTSPPTPVTYWTVSFDPNGGTSGAVPPSSQIFDTGLYNIPGNSGSLAKSDGSTFLGWNTNAAGTGILYSSGSKMQMTSNVVLYATWSPTATSVPPTTVATPELQVIVPTSPNPDDLLVSFPDQLPKTGIDLGREVLAAFVLGLATLALAFERRFRMLLTGIRRTRRAGR
ncbi:MAG: hypothetical protein RIT23_566 [Actinomycetota bacterium]